MSVVPQRPAEAPLVPGTPQDGELTAVLAVSVLGVAAVVFRTRTHQPGNVDKVRNSRSRAAVQMGLLDGLIGGKGFDAPVVMGTEEMMSQKEFGTSAVPIQKDLRWNCDVQTADRICNYNRHYAEYGGYWERETTFLKEESEASGEITFYDSNTGKPLFYGPRDRKWGDFVRESQVHGWPSFRDSEVNWDYVRVLPNGECISVDGTHLGHNLPDGSGNRYCINLVSVAGRPTE
jgi:peptide methionine sulfoxide reductase MsrB